MPHQTVRDICASVIRIAVYEGIPFVRGRMESDERLKQLKEMQNERMKGMARLVEVSRVAKEEEPAPTPTPQKAGDTDAKAGAYLRESAPTLYKAILQKTTS